MAKPTIHVQGLKELERAFKLADKLEQKELRTVLKATALPVKQAAESKAISRIRRMPRSPAWSQMRIGVGRSVVYMVPKRKNRGGSKRKNLRDLLLDRAMEPALTENIPEVTMAVENMLADVGRKWEQL